MKNNPAYAIQTNGKPIDFEKTLKPNEKVISKFVLFRDSLTDKQYNLKFLLGFLYAVFRFSAIALGVILITKNIIWLGILLITVLGIASQLPIMILARPLTETQPLIRYYITTLRVVQRKTKYCDIPCKDAEIYFRDLNEITIETVDNAKAKTPTYTIHLFSEYGDFDILKIKDGPSTFEKLEELRLLAKENELY